MPTVAQAPAAAPQPVAIAAAAGGEAPGGKGDLGSASLHYNRALTALRAGDWAQFGAEMQKLGAERGQPSDSVHH
jgi:hypothetical protein